MRRIAAQAVDRPTALLTACAGGGGLLLVASYHHAAYLTADTDQLTFALYWLGFLTGTLALAAVACAPATDPSARRLAVIGLALFGTLPRLLRSPGGPLGSDEFAHYRQILETYRFGDVGHVSYLLPITQDFPGLHQLVSALSHLTGVPLWTTGLAVITLAHLLSLLAVHQLAAALGAPPPAAALAAVVYLLNPSWVLFDTSVSYESLAVPLLIWCLAAVTAACRRRGVPAVRLVAAATAAALTLPLVHHLTAIAMCLLLLTLAVAGAIGRWQAVRRARSGVSPGLQAVETVWPRLVVLAGGLAATLWWFLGRADLIVGYLSPSLSRSWSQLRRIASGSPTAAGPGAGQGTGLRSLFAGTQLPFYEVVLGLLFPVLVLGLVVLAGTVLRRHRDRLGPTVWAFGLLAGAFFLSLPALFTAGGSEGAHRSWAFSFIGIAVLCGLAYGFVLQEGRSPGPTVPGRVTGLVSWLHSVTGQGQVQVQGQGQVQVRPARLAAVGGVLAALIVGSTAVSAANVSSRFPGVPRVGDDTRAVNPGGRAVSTWVAARARPDTPVLADRSVSLELGSAGRMATLSPSPGFPVWELFQQARPIRPAVLRAVHDAGIRFIVVDSRMATTRPAIGYWFTVDEPGSGGTTPYPAAAIARFACLPWLVARYAAGPLTVYEVDRDLLIRSLTGSCPGQVRP